ncbi:PREDICTED: uncharacterized protein LOC109127719 [Camelina sativa]|uniref:Uncharacterized protein LOC109127719 n=1 Tax=Camelina sativa TaxID=90675 RepID=A0ABM1QPF0_CAMSA|nr:PREDICTED: uncharacterized protein LOC109127719 [Camelina sativa]
MLTSFELSLYYTPFCGSKIMSLMFEWMRTSSPPGNILGICNRGDFPSPPQSGYNLFTPFSDSSPHEDAISWRNLILTVSGTLEEDTCSETYESTSWFCSICHPDDDLPGDQAKFNLTMIIVIFLAKALKLSLVISLPKNMYLGGGRACLSRIFYPCRDSGTRMRILPP